MDLRHRTEENICTRLNLSHLSLPQIDFIHTNPPWLVYFFISLFLFFPLRCHVSRRELPESSQIKFLYFIENNAIRSRCSNALFYSISFWVSILFHRKTFWDFYLNIDAHRKCALGITNSKLGIFKGHLSKLDLIGTLLTAMMAGWGQQIKKYDKRLENCSCCTSSLMI